MKKTVPLSILLMMLTSVVFAQKSSEIWLDDLPIATFSEGIAGVNQKTNAGGEPIQLGAISYQRGLGIHSTGVLFFLMDGNAVSFTAMVGADDKANKTMITKFYVIGDRKILFESGEMKVGDNPKKVSVNLNGVKRLGLLVTTNEDVSRNYSDWADAKFTMVGSTVPGNIPNSDENIFLRRHLQKLPESILQKYLVPRPGNPFLFTIVASGEAPIQFSVENLPKGLSIDEKTGIITGNITDRGIYHTKMKAKNKYGENIKELLIKIGDTISLTPPIGWNGWNSWAREN